MTTLLLIVSMVLDIGIGAAAHKAVHQLSERLDSIEKELKKD